MLGFRQCKFNRNTLSFQRQTRGPKDVQALKLRSSAPADIKVSAGGEGRYKVLLEIILIEESAASLGSYEPVAAVQDSSC